TGGNPIPPTPVVGCVGLVPDVRLVSRGWSEGDRVYFVPGEGAELVRFACEAARKGALVTDGTLEEVASWCGVPVDLEQPEGPGILVALRGTISGGDLVQELGTI